MLSREEFAELVSRANQGEPEAVIELRWLLDERPEIWQQIGDLSLHAEEALLTLVAGSDLLARESIARKLRSLRDELVGPSPTPLEQLAVDRIAICWLQVQYADTLFGGTHQAASKRTAMTIRWLDQAARRYNAAVRSLLDIRRLLPAATHGQGPPGRKTTLRPKLRVFGAGERMEHRTGTGT